MALLDRIKRVWNAFTAEEQRYGYPASYNQVGPSTTTRLDRTRLRFSTERSIIASIYTRLAIDVAAIQIRHVKLDEKKRYKEDMPSELNACLLFEPNEDQAPRAFRQDIALSLFDNGVAAIVPVDTLSDPTTGSFDVATMRVGTIVEWYPRHVRVNVYNIETGMRQDVTLEKKMVAIVENPLYAVMNEQNSTLQRLLRKLHLLDVVDEQSSSGKLDLIIQLPYVIKSETRRQQAEQRRQDIEFQLKGSQYGIAYTDGTEKITQLNRPAENNLFKQVEYLMGLLYSQLGLTEEVMNGTADEAAMLNYFNRTVEPIVDAIVEAMRRSLIGRNGFDRGETIKYFNNPFKLVPIGQMAEIADKFTRNEILTSNEIRDAIGYVPADDPKADELKNSNMPQPTDEVAPKETNDATASPSENSVDRKDNQNGS